MIKIVSDTSPIVGLAKINRLSLLKSISSEVLIPPMVYRELLSKLSNEWEVIDNALNDFIKVTELTPLDNAAKIALMDIDNGEREAIGLAYNIHNALLLIDDKAGRKAAEKLKITFTGVVGLILLFKEKGLISNVSKTVEDLRDSGYWLSDSLVEMVKRLAGEQ